MDILREEKKLWKKGFKIVACIDEAGRGPLAGPVVACAVVIFRKKKTDTQFRQILKNIKDSKKLTFKKREELYGILTDHPRIEWATSKASEKVIDKINILEATKRAMERAVKNLTKKLKKRKIRFLIIDGNFGINLDTPQKSIVKADEKVFSVMAASIIAKVTRDRIMLRLQKKYPVYEFARHKGYPTKLHCRLLKKHGFCKIHRKTFRPVKYLTKKPLGKF